MGVVTLHRVSAKNLPPEIPKTNAILIDTRYHLDGDNRVSAVVWSEGTVRGAEGQICYALLNNDNPDRYDYYSRLMDDDEPVKAPNPMSLADCILAANVHLGLIPPQNFDPIDCSNEY